MRIETHQREIQETVGLVLLFAALRLGARTISDRGSGRGGDRFRASQAGYTTNTHLGVVATIWSILGRDSRDLKCAAQFSESSLRRHSPAHLRAAPIAGVTTDRGVDPWPPPPRLSLAFDRGT